VVGDLVAREHADQAGGNRGDDDEPREALVGSLDSPCAQRPGPRREERDELTPEVRRDRDERSEVECDVERLVERLVLLQVLPAAEPRDEDQVPRGGDRQELRRPLHEAEHERLPVREASRLVPHSEHGQYERGEEGRGGDGEDGGAAHARILIRPVSAPAEGPAEAPRENFSQFADFTSRRDLPDAGTAPMFSPAGSTERD
jgi:hypothetical protein